jgi:hypothetical protein
MRSLLILLLLTVVVVATTEPKKHFLVGTPWYSEFLEEDDETARISPPKPMMVSKRRKGLDKPKEVSMKKVPKKPTEECKLHPNH